MEIINFTGYTLPEGVRETTCITIGSNFFVYVLLQIMSFVAGVGTLSGLATALVILIIFFAVWYVVRNRPKEYAKELAEVKEI